MTVPRPPGKRWGRAGNPPPWKRPEEPWWGGWRGLKGLKGKRGSAYEWLLLSTEVLLQLVVRSSFEVQASCHSVVVVRRAARLAALQPEALWESAGAPCHVRAEGLGVGGSKLKLRSNSSNAKWRGWLQTLWLGDTAPLSCAISWHCRIHMHMLGVVRAEPWNNCGTAEPARLGGTSSRGL